MQGEEIVECRITFWGRIAMDTPFLLLIMLGVVGLITLTPEEANSGRQLLLLVFLGLVCGAWAISRFSFVPSLKITVANDGLHGTMRIAVGHFTILSRTRTFTWQSVTRLVWFNSGYVVGFMAHGNDQYKRSGIMGPTILYSHMYEAARAIAERIPPDRIDESARKKLDKHFRSK